MIEFVSKSDGRAISVRADRVECVMQTADENVTTIHMSSGFTFEVVGHYESMREKVTPRERGPRFT